MNSSLNLTMFSDCKREIIQIRIMYSQNYSGMPISLEETLFKTRSLFETAKEDLEDKTEKEIKEPFKGRPGGT